MGDLRSGRELLASAARDLKTAPFAESTRAASCSHTLLRRFLAARCAELQEQLRQSDGARRPVRDSVSEVEAPSVAPTGGEDGPAIPRLESDGPAEDDAAHLNNSTVDSQDEMEWWSKGPLRAFWGFGQRRCGLTSLFDALPPALKIQLRLALDAADAADACRAADMAVVEASLDANGAASTSGGAPACHSLDAAELWEAETVWGYATAAFNPVTGRRLPGSIQINRRQAELMGASGPTEAAGRLEAGSAALLPAPESDVLAWAAHVLAWGSEGGAGRYGRAVVGCGEERGGALVHCVERRWLDGLGRLTRVSGERHCTVANLQECAFDVDLVCGYIRVN